LRQIERDLSTSMDPSSKLWTPTEYLNDPRLAGAIFFPHGVYLARQGFEIAPRSARTPPKLFVTPSIRTTGELGFIIQRSPASPQPTVVQASGADGAVL
jgi:hypothetical protein